MTTKKKDICNHIPAQVERFEAFKRCKHLDATTKEGIECRTEQFSLYKKLIQSKTNTPYWTMMDELTYHWTIN